MTVSSIQARPLAIPFKTAFRHASAERAATQSLLVAARSEDGTLGFGEGCPREYVTGESLASAQDFVLRHAGSVLQQVQDVETLKQWVRQHRQEIDAQPAAWTAVELALLDLFGKLRHQSVEALLGLQAVTGSYRYTAVLGDAPREKFAAQLAHYLKAGFTEFKIKLSGDPARDREKADVLRQSGIPSQSVRADANNAWQDAEAAIEALRSLDYSFFALEEPLPSGDFDGMRLVAAATGSRIILDESLVRLEQLACLRLDPNRWIVNLRVSKMGGILRSLELVEQVREAKLSINIGAHVGETSLLTRAALTIAANARDLLLSQEGAFGTHLLEHDITDNPVMFGAGGILDATMLNEDSGGLGIQIRPEILVQTPQE